MAEDAQLVARGLVLKRGTLIDASLVETDADVRKGPDGRSDRANVATGDRGKKLNGFLDTHSLGVPTSGRSV